MDYRGVVSYLLELPKDKDFLRENSIQLDEILHYKARRVLDKVYVELYVRREAIGEAQIDLFHNNRFVRTL